MHIEDEFVCRAVGILHPHQREARIRIEATKRGFVGAWEQDELGGGASVADCGHDGLEGVGPDGDVEIMGLVHQTEDDVGLVGVRLRELGPDGDEVVVGRSTVLANNAAVPAGIVVDVDDAVSAGGEAGLDQTIVVGKECRVKLTAELMGDEVLPAYRKAENVEAVVIGEMLHLTRTYACGTIRAATVTLYQLSVLE